MRKLAAAMLTAYHACSAGCITFTPKIWLLHIFYHSLQPKQYPCIFKYRNIWNELNPNSPLLLLLKFYAFFYNKYKNLIQFSLKIIQYTCFLQKNYFWPFSSSHTLQCKMHYVSNHMHAPFFCNKSTNLYFKISNFFQQKLNRREILSLAKIPLKPTNSFSD